MDNKLVNSGPKRREVDWLWPLCAVRAVQSSYLAPVRTVDFDQQIDPLLIRLSNDGSAIFELSGVDMLVGWRQRSLDFCSGNQLSGKLLWARQGAGKRRRVVNPPARKTERVGRAGYGHQTRRTNDKELNGSTVSEKFAHTLSFSSTAEA
jgi:hypothetical protein